MRAGRFEFLGALGLAALALAGCASSDPEAGPADAGPPDAGPQAPAIGTGDHTPSSVTFVAIAESDDGVQLPTDLAFNPRIPDELWVTNYDDDSVVVIHEATSDPDPEYLKDWYGLFTGEPASHFMPNPTSIAFGRDETSDTPEPVGAGGILGTFATCGDNRNDYDGFGTPNDFMGAALWPSDLEMFANRPDTFLGSHLDMLHCGPQCMGIAHQEENVYWAFAGRARDPEDPFCTFTMFGPECSFVSDSAIVYYDFQEDHGPGNDDHSDGEAYQYVTGEVDRVPGVPSHLVYDAETALLYIADTGNGRIAALDTTTGDVGDDLEPMEPMNTYAMVDDAVITDVVAAGGVLERPSGLELHEGLLYVSDHATGIIHAFDLSGERVNYLDTGRGEDALAGMAFGPDGRIYLVDMETDEVLRLDP
jgi:hypothetical protein